VLGLGKDLSVVYSKDNIDKNGCTDVCLSVCLSVGMWRANGNPNPCTDLHEILQAIPTCPMKVLVQV